MFPLKKKKNKFQACNNFLTKVKFKKPSIARHVLFRGFIFLFRDLHFLGSSFSFFEGLRSSIFMFGVFVFHTTKLWAGFLEEYWFLSTWISNCFFKLLRFLLEVGRFNCIKHYYFYFFCIYSMAWLAEISALSAWLSQLIQLLYLLNT